MPEPSPASTRVVAAVHGRRDSFLDPDFELGLTEHLRVTHSREAAV